MYIIMVTSECAPVAKVGGLADVIFGLGRELELRGNTVEIILPKYDCLRYDQIGDLHEVYHDLWVPWCGGAIHCSVWFGWVHGRRCFFIDPHSQDSFFNRGHFYGSWDDVTRFAFFSKATLEFLLKSNKRPDIIHCHDWQTALVSVLLYESYQHGGMYSQRVCFTIHNFMHQGMAGDYVLWATGLNRPEHFFHYDRLRDNANPFALNLMKGGIVYANFVTTVSPQHAWEAMYTEQGYGLGHTLYLHQHKFGGILNGVDYDIWNPEIDPLLPCRYTSDNVAAKYGNKEALRNRLWLRQDFKPLVAYIGRLDRQKGVDLIRHALFYSIWNGAQFVLLGSSPDPDINNYFWHLKQHLNDNPDCHLEIGFNEELAHLIYAGADMVVVPSLFEPCGLTQMMALRYGSVPIVRAVGGLMDTVFDRDYSSRPPEARNGYVFQQANEGALESAMHRAFGLWYHYPQEFRQLLINGMRYDYSWNRPAQDYLNIYDYIRHK
jgi:starch synthase